MADKTLKSITFPGLSDRYVVPDNSADIEQIKEDLNAKASAIISTSDEAEVVAFGDGANDMPMESVVLRLVPHQEGSGDPSPENVRPISGYTSVNVYHNTSQSVTGATTYSITFPASAGTVYGGELDVAKGTLKVDRKFVEMIGTGGDQALGTLMRKGGNTARNEFFTFGTNSGLYPSYLSNVNELQCSHFKTLLVAQNNEYMCYVAAGQFRIILPLNNTLGISTADQMNAWISQQRSNGTPVQFCIKLLNPTEITLDPTTIKTLLGTNAIWMDADGTIQADYPADTKKYIDALTAPDGDMVADSNIASGKYFTVNNRLYLSTSAIAQGEAIVVGTNCTQTDLATALNAINA